MPLALLGVAIARREASRRDLPLLDSGRLRYRVGGDGAGQTQDCDSKEKAFEEHCGGWVRVVSLVVFRKGELGIQA